MKLTSKRPIRIAASYLALLLAYVLARTVLAFASTRHSPVGPEASTAILVLTLIALLFRFALLFVALPLAIYKILYLSICRKFL